MAKNDTVVDNNDFDCEDLHAAFDSLQSLESTVRSFCGRWDCSECPLGKHIDPDAAYPADACPTLQHIRELRYILQDHVRKTVVEEKGLDKYKVDWINNQKVFFKGFDQDLCCRGMQFEVGWEFSVDGSAVICVNGIHFCCNILEVFDHYSLPWSRYCTVTVPEGDDVSVDFASSYGETKRCATKVKIECELSLSDLVRKLQSGYGFRYEIGTWFSSDTITVGTDWAYYWCNAPVGVLTGCYSMMHLDGYIGVAKACNSAVYIDWEHAVAIGMKEHTVAHTTGFHSIAIAKEWRSIALADGTGSIAIAHASEATAIVAERYSVGVNVFGAGSIVRLESDYCVAVATGHTVVTAERCTVVIPYHHDSEEFSVCAVAGTRIVWVGNNDEEPVITTVSEDGPIKPNQTYVWSDFVWNVLGRPATWRD